MAFFRAYLQNSLYWHHGMYSSNPYCHNMSGSSTVVWPGYQNILRTLRAMCKHILVCIRYHNMYLHEVSDMYALIINTFCNEWNIATANSLNITTNQTANKVTLPKYYTKLFIVHSYSGYHTESSWSPCAIIGHFPKSEMTSKMLAEKSKNPHFLFKYFWWCFLYKIRANRPISPITRRIVNRAIYGRH